MLLPYQPDYKQDQLKVPGTGVCATGACNGQHSHQVTPLMVIKNSHKFFSYQLFRFLINATTFYSPSKRSRNESVIIHFFFGFRSVQLNLVSSLLLSSIFNYLLTHLFSVDGCCSLLSAARFFSDPWATHAVQRFLRRHAAKQKRKRGWRGNDTHSALFSFLFCHFHCLTFLQMTL